MVISLRNIYCGYTKEELIFKNFNKDFEGNLIKIEASNGTGKSTLFKFLSGKLDFKGKIYIDNKEVKKRDLSKIFILVNQDIQLIEEYKVKTNIELINRKYKNDIIEKFGFSDKLDIKVSELSGGWKKKLMLLMAFLSNPEVLLLDEYSNYLDKEFVYEFNELIKEYSKEKVILYIDHNNEIEGSIITTLDGNTVNAIETTSKYKIHNKLNLNLLKAFLSSIKLIYCLILIIVFTFFMTIGGFYNVTRLENSYYDIEANYCTENKINFQLLVSDIPTTNQKLRYIEGERFIDKLNHLDIMFNQTYYFDFDLDELFSTKHIENNSGYQGIYVFQKYEQCLGNLIEYSGNKYFVEGIAQRNNKYENEALVYDAILINGVPDYPLEYCGYATILTDEELHDFVYNKLTINTYKIVSKENELSKNKFIDLKFGSNFLGQKVADLMSKQLISIRNNIKRLVAENLIDLLFNIFLYLAVIIPLVFINKSIRNRMKVLLHYNVSKREIFYAHIIEALAISFSASLMAALLSSALVKSLIRMYTESYTTFTNFFYIIPYFAFSTLLILIVNFINVKNIFKK